MIHIYYGNGKGKTTAAVGLAVRAAGRGVPVLFAQFMKDGSSGEVGVLACIDGVNVLAPERFYGFFSSMSEQQKVEMRDEYRKELELIADYLASNSSRALIVLDEVLHAVRNNLVDEDWLHNFLTGFGPGIEVVMTGAEPSARFREAADYITCMNKEKHPYDRGVFAREGVEY